MPPRMVGVVMAIEGVVMANVVVGRMNVGVGRVMVPTVAVGSAGGKAVARVVVVAGARGGERAERGDG